jgi:glycosyltransferase involved in cell wall biosynthesis
MTPASSAPLRLAVEGLGATEGPTDGAGRYLSGLLTALGRRTDVSTSVYVGPSMADTARAIPGLDRVVVLPTRSRVSRIAVQHLTLPALSLLHGADVVIYSSNYLPVVGSRRAVAIVQNMFLVHPARAPGRGRSLYRRLMRSLIAARADVVVAVSSFMARELERVAPRLADRTQVIYPALDIDHFRSGARQARRTDRPYFLAVGTVWRHRNFDLALQALARSSLPHRLVIAGAAPSAESSRLRQVAHDLGVSDRLEFLGVVDPSDMPLWYGGATALVATSELESFGMSIIEAMAAGAPVVAVRRTAYQETVGTAGLLVDPDPEALAGALVEVTRPATRQRLITSGEERAILFGFARYTNQLVDICRACRDGRPGSGRRDAHR